MLFDLTNRPMNLSIYSSVYLGPSNRIWWEERRKKKRSQSCEPTSTVLWMAFGLTILVFLLSSLAHQNHPWAHMWVAAYWLPSPDLEEKTEWWNGLERFKFSTQAPAIHKNVKVIVILWFIILKCASMINVWQNSGGDWSKKKRKLAFFSIFLR